MLAEMALPRSRPDLVGVDVERGDELDVADVVAAELDVHQPGHVLGRVGVAVELDALHEAARAVPDAGDRDADALRAWRGLRGRWSCGGSFRAVGERDVALLRDQLLDPREIVLGGLGPVLEERPGVAIGAAGGTAPRLGEPLRELRAPALEEREAVGGAEVAAERELQREGALVVGTLRR